MDSGKLIFFSNKTNILIIFFFSSFSMAKLCQSLGLTVMACCLSESSKGARFLGNLNPPNKPAIQVQPLDITVPESIFRMKRHLKELLVGSEFYALVNNAGFMAFGEFEWLNSPLLHRHIEVNLLGTMNITHALLPLLRESSQKKENLGSRIINVTSHCSLVALPGLSVYAASKAGLSFYTSALQIELKKYNVRVINFIPGSFVLQSGILRRQKKFGEEMWNGMNEEQKEFYGDYFREYNDYIGAVSEMVPTDVMDVDLRILEAFREAIIASDPQRRYLVEPLRYKLYHKMFDILPDSGMRDRLIQRFMKMPKYKKKSCKSGIKEE